MPGQLPVFCRNVEKLFVYLRHLLNYIFCQVGSLRVVYVRIWRIRLSSHTKLCSFEKKFGKSHYHNPNKRLGLNHDLSYKCSTHDLARTCSKLEKNDLLDTLQFTGGGGGLRRLRRRLHEHTKHKKVKINKTRKSRFDNIVKPLTTKNPDDLSLHKP